MILTERQLRKAIHEFLLEYVVPMGFSLNRWEKYKKKHNISNKQ